MFRIEELDREGAAAYEAALIERAAWLDERGMGMWKAEHLTVAGMEARYPKPRFYGAFEGPQLVGGFALLEQDPRYWPDSAGDKAFYFHKFVVGPRFAGRGYADRMLEWVKDLAERSGKDFLRLDYDGSRPYLRGMYLRHGFEDASSTATPEGRKLVLGEYRTASGSRQRAGDRPASGAAIRAWRESDLPAFKELLDQLNDDLGLPERVDPADLEAHFRAMAGDPAYGSFVYEDGGRIDGLIAWAHYRSLLHRKGTALINELVVRRSRMGSGIGSALLRYAIEAARLAGMDEIEVGVMKENVQAIEFYKKNGMDEEYFLLGREFGEG
jgi:ribosomal protein S18 acetylase RimI-like enzyme